MSIKEGKHCVFVSIDVLFEKKKHGPVTSPLYLLPAFDSTYRQKDHDKLFASLFQKRILVIWSRAAMRIVYVQCSYVLSMVLP